MMLTCIHNGVTSYAWKTNMNPVWCIDKLWLYTIMLAKHSFDAPELLCLDMILNIQWKYWNYPVTMFWVWTMMQCTSHPMDISSALHFLCSVECACTCPMPNSLLVSSSLWNMPMRHNLDINHCFVVSISTILQRMNKSRTIFHVKMQEVYVMCTIQDVHTFSYRMNFSEANISIEVCSKWNLRTTMCAFGKNRNLSNLNYDTSANQVWLQLGINRCIHMQVDAWAWGWLS